MRAWVVGLLVGVGASAPAWGSACENVNAGERVTCEGDNYQTIVADMTSISPVPPGYANNVWNNYLGCVNAQQPKSERLLPFSCRTSGWVRLRMSDTECDIDFYVLDDTCDPNATASCIAHNTDDYTLGPTFEDEFWCDAGREYTIVVEGWGFNRPLLNPACPTYCWGGAGCPTTVKASKFTMRAFCEEVCDDGFDNDQDQKIDCLDADCLADPACAAPTEEDCDRTGDEDGDGLSDCDDPDCADAAACCDVDGDGVWADTTFCSFGGDCDDTDPDRYPGHAEVPGDGVDQSCDGLEACYTDEDDDGWGVLPLVASADLTCSAPGLSFRAGDCDDTRASVHPGADEIVANGRDEDCNGGDTCYRDLDLDRFGSPHVIASDDLDCTDPGESTVDSDCDDTRDTVRPGATEIPYDGIDQDCDGADLDDLDGDGFAGGPAGPDCDDDDPDAWPGAPEIVADGVDQDCDGGDRCWRDADHDGVGGPDTVDGSDLTCTALGAAPTTGDCDDADPGRRPGLAEVPADGIDQDCRHGDACWADGDGDGFGSALIVPSDDLDCDDPGEARQPGDCDDADAARHPDAPEIPYDDVDQDCDGADLVDVDGDGSAGGPGGPDCDDGDPDVRPGAPELVADGVDQDCDGGDDCWRDGDGDGHGAPDVRVGSDDLDCDDPGESVTDDDCDDTDPGRSPGAAEIPYDGVDQDCDGVDLDDLDGDGAAGGDGPDCDDRDPAVRPGATELANGVDDDCDGVVDEGTIWYDDDGDGVTEAGGDCDDDDPQRAPGIAERPNGIDDDCDGVIDEGTARYDDDGDGWCEAGCAQEGDCHDGDPSIYPGAPEPPGSGVDKNCDGVLAGTDRDGDGYAVHGGDCDDDDPTRHPGREELPNGKDDDCDGLVDEGTELYDDDGDGACESTTAPCVNADVGGDCDDTRVSRSPLAAENPNNHIDDDCDGLVDEGGRHFDDDGDGYTEAGGDCDDGDPTVHPDAAETPDGRDEDCDGLVDEDFVDADGDGYTVAAGDCDDGNGWASPERPEACDGIDNDCDGDVDEGCRDREELADPPEGGGCSTVPSGPPGALALLTLFALRRRR